MENIEIFEKYISGKFNDFEEEQFYSEMANNVDFRNEFKSFSSIKNHIESNTDKFIPSDILKQNVFTKAGFPIAESSLNSIVAVASKPIANVWFSSIFAGLVGVLVSYFYFNGIGNPNTNDFSEFKITEMYPHEVIYMEIPSIENEVYNYQNKDNTTKATMNNKYNENSTPKISDTNISINELSSENSILKNFKLEKNNLQGIDEFNNYHSSFIDNNLGLIAEISGQVAWSFPQVDIYPEKFNPFNNLNAKLFYQFNNKIMLGVGISQETFNTVYQGTDDIGSIYSYKQQPNLTTYSAILRYLPFEFEHFSPFIETGLGLNKAGFIINPSIGLELNYLTNFNFTIGLNYKYFVFTHQNNYFNSDKISLSYGISYKL